MHPLEKSRRLYAACIVLLLLSAACETDLPVLLPATASPPAELQDHELIARFAHVTDTHLVDAESPARFAGAHELVHHSAWRPYEAYSTQLLDGILCTVNRLHASDRTIDFLLNTGDSCDNSQSNELAWMLGVFDGGAINPLTGPDDRPLESRPAPLLDPYAAFTAQGLYRSSVHGDLPSIPWYCLPGNHDRYAIGVFPIFQDLWGRRTAPLPLSQRPGLLLPTVLDPLAWFAHGNVTPAEPGPPCLLDLPRFVTPNTDRAYFNRSEFIRAMFGTATEPAGHGFINPDGPGWYSVELNGPWQKGTGSEPSTPGAIKKGLPRGACPLLPRAVKPGLRLIGLDTTEAAHAIEGFVYSEGSILAEQAAFLRAELDAAQDRGELVIVASHHPSDSLWDGYGSAFVGSTFRALLAKHDNVVLHIVGHGHHNAVMDRGTYLEIETCSTLDAPQEGRLIEIWRNPADGTIAVAYEMFSHLDDSLPPLGEDPLRPLREAAQQLAHGSHDDPTRAILPRSPVVAEPLQPDAAAREASDRQGIKYRPRPHFAPGS